MAKSKYSATVKGGGKIHVGSLNGGKNDIKNVGGAPENRDDIRRMFIDELGFKDVEGLNNLDTAILGAQGIALNGLERKYGALKYLGVGSMSVKGMDSSTAIAAVSYTDFMKSPDTLLINRKKFSTVSGRNAAQREAEKSGWSMPTDGSVMSLARYAITHEYGHIIEAALYKRERAAGSKIPSGSHAVQVRREIVRLAEQKYGATQRDLSSYGASDSYEFFAEAFANANSGRPNAIGRAMIEYLKKSGL